MTKKLPITISAMRDSTFFKVSGKCTLVTFIVCQLSSVAPVFASPTGGTVVGGQGSIDYQGASTTINQASNRLAIDWKTFNVGESESVQFLQPGRDAIALNRILDQNPSQILGHIDANGNIMLINARGIIFGRGASINVGGLVASSLDVNPNELMNGQSFSFSAVEGTEGAVINRGLINAATGGSVSLIGKSVQNEGTIVANLGKVNMAAGSEAVLTFGRDGLMGVEVTKEVLENDIGVDSTVLNSGTITGEGSQVALTAKVSRDLFSNAVNNTGIIQATGIEEHGGSIYLTGSGGDVTNHGTLNVSSSEDGVNGGTVLVSGDNVNHSGVITADGQQGNGGVVQLTSQDTTLLTGNSVISARSETEGIGGNVRVLGDKVGVLDQSMIDASGAQDGGTVLIGGDFQGKNAAVKNAIRTVVGQQATVNANAEKQGNGGKVVVWSDVTTVYKGTVNSKGGQESGNGGFVEISGKQNLAYSGVVDRAAVNGEAGTLLLDPDSINIVADGTTPNDNGQIADREVLLADVPGATFNITSGSVVSEMTNGNVILEAATSINVQDTIDASSAGNGNSLSMTAGTATTVGTITVSDGMSILTNNGAVDLTGSVTLGNGTQIVTNGGSVTIEGENYDGALATINTTGRQNQTSGSVSIITNNGDLITGGINTSGGSARNQQGSAGGNITLTANNGFSVNVQGGLNSQGGNGEARGGGSPQSMNGGSGGNIGITADGGIAVQNVVATGGNGDFTFSGGNATGGDGGQITFTANAGPVTLNNNITSIGGRDDLSISAPINGQGGVIQLNGSVEIAGTNVSIDTGPTGGSITFDKTLDSAAASANNLSLTAGSGDIAFNSVAGATTRLNAVTIQSAHDVNINANFTAGSFDVSAVSNNFDSVGTLINTSGIVDADGGAISISAANQLAIGDLQASAGVDNAADGAQSAGTITLNGGVVSVNTITVNGGVSASGNGGNGGAVSITAGNGDIVVDNSITTLGGNGTAGGAGGTGGAITLNAGGGQTVTLNGSIDTAGGAGDGTGADGNGGRIWIRDDFTPGLNAALKTGAAGGSIDFDGAINGAELLTLASGTGDITFNQAIGDATPVNIVIDSARNVTAIGSVSADSFKQTAGSGTTQLQAAFVGGGGGLDVTTDTVTTNAITVDNGAVMLAATNIDINGNVATGGGDVTLTTSTTLTIDNNVTTGNGDIKVNNSATFNNNYSNGVINTGTGNITINSAGDVRLGLVQTTSGNPATEGMLSVTSTTGTITQPSTGAGRRLDIGGNAAFVASDGTAYQNVSLTNTNNTIAGSISVTGQDVVLREASGNDIELGASTVNNNLDISGDNAVTQSEAITVSGVATIDAQQNEINLSHAGNDFNQVNLSNGGNNSVSVTDTNAIAIAAMNLGTGALAITANGITQTGAIVQEVSAGVVTLDGGAGQIALNNNANDFTGTVNVTGGSQADIADANDLSIGDVAVEGNVTVAAGRNLTLTGLVNLAQPVGRGTLILNSGQAGAGSRMDLGSASYTVANITANGGGGNDTLFINDDDKTWTIDGSNQGKISRMNGVSDDDTANNPALRFNSMERLEGGSGIDIFTFQGNGQISQGIDGGDGVLDEVDLSQQAVVNITFGFGAANGVSNVEAVRGNNTDSTLTARSVANTWTISDVNSGRLQEDVSQEALTFYGFNKLNGGSGKDAYNFNGTGAVTGYIDGRGSNAAPDSISLAGLSSNHQWYFEAAGARVEVEGTQSTVIGSFNNITQVTGGSGSDTFNVTAFDALDGIDGGNGVDTIVGANVDGVLWTISDRGQGVMRANGTDQYSFSGVENLQGGTLADTFDFGAGNAQMNSIAGGGGADTLRGGAGGDKIWQLRSGPTHQYQNDQGGKITDFSGISVIQGGTASDLFVFDTGADFGGAIYGGGGMGVDTLDYSQFTTSVSVNLANGSATATTAIGNIENLIGGLAADTLTGGDASNNDWDISGINSGNVNSFTFRSVENITGGVLDDTFNMAAGGNITGLIDGAAGDDTLNVVYGDTGHSVTFDGGAGTNTANLGGSAPSLSGFYTLSDASPDRLTGQIGNQTVNMSNIAQVNDTIIADSITITGSDADNDVQIGAVNITGNIAGNNPTSVMFANFIPINFANKQNVSINGGDGTDTMTLMSDIAASGTFSLAGENINNPQYMVSAGTLVLDGFESVGATDQPFRTEVNSLALVDIGGSAHILEADNGITLMASNVGTDLELAAISGDIVSSGGLIVGGNVSVTGAAGASVALNDSGNTFGGELTLTTFDPTTGALGNVQLNNNGAVVLATVNASQLAVNAAGDITDSPQGATINVSGAAQFNANGNNVILDGATTDLGVVAASNVNEFNVTDTNDIGVGAVSARTVVINAGGQISDAGSSIVAESAQLNAQNGVGNNNRLQTAVRLLTVDNTNSGNININNTGSLTIAAIRNESSASSGGSVAVASSESITQSGQISAGNNVTLTAGSHYAQQGNIAAENDIAVTATNGAITMQEGTRTDSTGATIRYTSQETVTVSSLDAVYAQGRVEVSSGQGNIISSRAPDLSRPNITGNYALFDAPFGSLGEPGRPLVINIPGTVVINTFTSVAPIYLVPPANVIDTSRLLFDINEAIAELGGNQRTEVDALAIIDPAVFTQVKNYSEDLYPVKLPPDQLLTEDEDEKKKKRQSGEDPDIFSVEPQ